MGLEKKLVGMYQFAIQVGLRHLASQSRQGMFLCYVSDSEDMSALKLSPPDVASSILVLDLLERLFPDHSLARDVRRYAEERDRGGLFSYFDYPYPADVDDSAVGIMVVGGGKPKARYIGTVNRIINNTDETGVIHVWLEPGHEQRVDAVTCVNGVRLAARYGRVDEVGPTVEYIVAHLVSDRYLDGTRYYHQSQAFIYFMTKLQVETGLISQNLDLLQKAVRRGLAASSGPVSLAMMVSASKLLGLDSRVFGERLATMQQPDGSWPIDSLWHFGSKTDSGYFGSGILSTTFAIEALAE